MAYPATFEDAVAVVLACAGVVTIDDVSPY